jgi:regulator of sigma E protease
MMQIIVSLLLLSFLILIHELGHLWGAKLFKVKVWEFSIFMGPKITSFKTAKTEYSLRAIPIGGYVAMEGENEDSDDKDALMNKPKWQQAIIMFSGALMNLIFGLIAFFILTQVSGYMTPKLADTASNVPDINIFIQDENSRYDITSPALRAGLLDGDRIIRFNGRKVLYPIDILIYSMESKDTPVEIEYERDGEIYTTELNPAVIPQTEIYRMGVFFMSSGSGFDSSIQDITPGSPAQQAGIQPMDKIISIDDRLIMTRDDISTALAQSGGREVKIKVLRSGKETDLYLTPERVVQDRAVYHGLYFEAGTNDFFDKTAASFRYFGSIIKSVYYSIGWLITGRVSIKEAMGPVGIISTIGNVVASRDTIMNIIKQLLSLMGLISVNLGLINLVPFPALDGSKLVILGIEAVTRKRIPIEKQATISFVGFVILIIMLLAVTSLDIMRLFGR